MNEKRSILLVDDETNVLKSLKRNFIETDYKIYTAESAEGGIEILNQHEIGLVISDYKMPKTNGVQFLKEVKEKFPKTIRMILSGYADVSSIVEAINEGNVYKFLCKPWNDQEILTTIKRAFEHFDLQLINEKLVDDLQNSNQELSLLTRSLEKTIDERTSELRIKNNALKISQHILNNLPIGVLGVDISGMIVYINEMSKCYLSHYGFNLGSLISDSNSEVGKIISLKLESCTEIQESKIATDDAMITITPLTNGGGIIVVLDFNKSIKEENMNESSYCGTNDGR